MVKQKNRMILRRGNRCITLIIMLSLLQYTWAENDGMYYSDDDRFSRPVGVGATPINFPSTYAPFEKPKKSLTSPSRLRTKYPSTSTVPSKSSYPSISLPTFQSEEPYPKTSRKPSTIPLDSSSIQPSKNQSKEPSTSPSHLQTKVPSTVPSNYPSVSLTTLPSKKPISITSNKPSANSLNPSVSPSPLPSSQSNTPSLTPSIQQSNLPSLFRNNFPFGTSGGPSLSICSLSSAGFYGSQTTREVLIKYEYKMNYLQSYNISEILEDLEYAISTLVMKSTISECNTSKTITMQETQQKIDPESKIIGISSTPNDLVVHTCESQSPPQVSNISCNIINGGITFYLQDITLRLQSLPINIDNVIENVTKIIADEMNGGVELASAHTAIVDLTYIAIDILEIQNVNVTERGEKGSEFLTFGRILLSCVMVFVLGVLGYIGRTVAMTRQFHP